jgi:hypothetical protein
MVSVLVKVLRLLVWSVISLNNPGIYGSIELPLYWPEPAQYLVVRYNVWYHLVLVHIRKNKSTGQICLGHGWRAEAVFWVRYFTRSVHVKTIELPMYWPEPAPYLAVTYYLQYIILCLYILGRSFQLWYYEIVRNTSKLSIVR